MFLRKALKRAAARRIRRTRGRKKILDHVAASLSGFTGASIDPEENLILTPGTQGALFLAMGANIMPGDKVAIVEPDYFANRKMVEFFGGQMVPVVLEYENEGGRAGISLESLEEAFKDGVKLFLFSNPNNPVGCVYSYEEITGIAALAKKYGVTLIVDELYSRPGVSWHSLYPSVRPEGDPREPDHDPGAVQNRILKRIPPGSGLWNGRDH